MPVLWPKAATAANPFSLKNMVFTGFGLFISSCMRMNNYYHVFMNFSSPSAKNTF